MPVRTCPNCESKLFSFNNYFCTTCGSKLPAEIVAPAVPFSAYKAPLHKEESGESIVIEPQKKGLFENFHIDLKVNVDKKVLLSVAIALFGGIALLTFKVLLPRFTEPMITEASLENDKPEDLQTLQKEHILSSELELVTDTFEKSILINYLPHDIDFFVMAHDLSLLLMNDKFFDEEFSKAVRDNFNESFTIFSLREDSQRKWSILLLPKEGAQIDKIGQFMDTSYWKYKVLDSVLVVTESENVIEMVESSYQKVSKGIKHNPKYASSIKNVPAEGQALVVFFDYEGKKAFERLKGYEETSVLERLIRKVLDFGSNEIVLR